MSDNNNNNNSGDNETANIKVVPFKGREAPEEKTIELPEKQKQVIKLWTIFANGSTYQATGLIAITSMLTVFGEDGEIFLSMPVSPDLVVMDEEHVRVL